MDRRYPHGLPSRMRDVLLFLTQCLTTIIRAKLTDGKLPFDWIPRDWGRRGNREPCDVCEEPITPPEFLIEGTASEGGGGVQFHVRCFYLWDALRRVSIS